MVEVWGRRGKGVLGFLWIVGAGWWTWWLNEGNVAVRSRRSRFGMFCGLVLAVCGAVTEEQQGMRG